ncbi:hypothetical protein [Leifsonia sp. TF02-11]|uniref:hypothetical protein n=1 Tax=Leifsonia sp. TF02-11 TaxID=2815212 RepID=UPI001AA1765F|nr:hypothetical protein [Leifsonia sp. TF02-11]MBO1737397.1 hypothetical protein [Leifsonia sp. TF02-11]
MNDKTNIDDELTRLRTENEELHRALRELSHAQLIARDVELGLRAELLQTRLNLINDAATHQHTVNLIRQSTTWRLGRLLTKPFAAARKVGRRLK